MPTFSNDSATTTLFVFNHIIAQFKVQNAIVTNHGKHFLNHMMAKLSAKLGFHHENSSPYHPQANKQVEAINKVLKTIIQQMVGTHKSNWHLKRFSSLWS